MMNPSLDAWSGRFAALLVPGVVWVLAVRVAWPEWEMNPQYQYGLAVPLLCAVFFALRWKDRPDPEPGRGVAAVLAALALGVSTVVLGAIQPVFEANPGWRLLVALSLFAAIVWTMCAVFFAGGMPWVRHFLFPVALLLAGIPWPHELESAVMGVLININSGIVVELLHWCGYAAQRQGNLIQLPGGLLGVEEACSGIRSLQTGIVAALAYGELLRLSAARRWVLVGVGLGATLAGNTARLILLSLVATNLGFEAEQLWHGPAGVVVLAGTIIAIGIAGSFLARGQDLPASGAGVSDLSGLVRWMPLLVVSAALLAITWAGTEAWYRSHERTDARPVNWTLARQSASGKAKDLKVSERTLDILRFPEGFSESWVDGGGLRWQAYYFRWGPGKVGSQVTYTHTPTSCLASTGMVLEETYPPLVYENGGLRLVIDAYRFRDKGRPLYVFHSITEDYSSAGDEAPAGGAEIKGRFDAVRVGRRNRGQRLLEMAAWNARSFQDAERGLRATLDTNIRIQEKAGR